MNEAGQDHAGARRGALPFTCSSRGGGLAVAALLAAVGAFFVSGALSLRFGDVALPGPGFLPFALGLALMALAAAVFAVTLREPRVASVVELGHPPVLIAFACLAWGVGLWIASSTAKYRDLSIATPFLLQLWLFATPIIYPLSSVPQDWRLAVALLNPLAPLIEALRWILIGAGSVEPLPLAVAALEIAIILLTGAMLFQRVERTVVDTV